MSEINELKNAYPNNSKRPSVKVVSQKQLDEKITRKLELKGSVSTQKKPIGKKLKNLFIGEDAGNVSVYILHDVLIPAAKSTISDMVSTGIEMLMFGEARNTRAKRSGDRSFVSYHNPSTSRRGEPIGRSEKRNRSGHDFDDILLETRGDAEMVLTRLADLVEDYGQATVADLYDLVDISGNYTDSRYGWTNLSRASVVQVRGGFLLDLPRTEVL